MLGFYESKLFFCRLMMVLVRESLRMKRKVWFSYMYYYFSVYSLSHCGISLHFLNCKGLMHDLFGLMDGYSSLAQWLSIY